MRTNIDILISVLDGWQYNGDIKKYASLEEINRAEPAIVEAYQRVESANRELTLVIKGALHEKDD